MAYPQSSDFSDPQASVWFVIQGQTAQRWLRNNPAVLGRYTQDSIGRADTVKLVASGTAMDLLYALRDRLAAQRNSDPIASSDGGDGSWNGYVLRALQIYLNDLVGSNPSAMPMGLPAVVVDDLRAKRISPRTLQLAIAATYFGSDYTNFILDDISLGNQPDLRLPVFDAVMYSRGYQPSGPFRMTVMPGTATEVSSIQTPSTSPPNNTSPPGTEMTSEGPVTVRGSVSVAWPILAGFLAGATGAWLLWPKSR